jgi:hypothetical protein
MWSMLDSSMPAKSISEHDIMCTHLLAHQAWLQSYTRMNQAFDTRISSECDPYDEVTSRCGL